VPESMLKIVLLPEPFGPIKRDLALIDPERHLVEAVKPPNRFTKPSTDQHGVPSVDPGPSICSCRSLPAGSAARLRVAPGS